MTDELKPCLAYPCDGVMKANLYDASLTCSKCQFQVADESEYAALVAGRQAAIDDEEQNPWKAAIIQELIVDCILTEELERDPRKALAVAIDWNCKVALDPSVSKEAQDLQQRAIDAAQARIDALEKQRASLFKEGAEAAVIAAERIAELEGKLRSADGLAKFNSNLFTEQARRIAELERENEILKTIPMKYRRMGFNAVLQDKIEELERELAEARKVATKDFGAKLARALISIGDEPGWPATRMAYKSRVGEVEREQGGMNEYALASFFQDFIDAAMRQEGE